MRPIAGILIDGVALDARVERNLTPASQIVRSMDGASLLTLAIDDPDRSILESGVLARTSKGRVRRGLETAPWQRLGKVRLSWEGTFWRLASADFDGPLLVTRWEPEIIAMLRAHHKHVRLSRANGTRANFVNRLLSTPRARVIPRRVFDSNRRLPIEKVDVTDQAPRVGKKGIDLDANLQIKGVKATREQLRQANLAFGEADKQGAGDRATLALGVAGIGESGFRAIPNAAGSGYAGVFQASPANIPMKDTAQQAHYFLRGGKGFQAGGAILLARQEPEATPGSIATRVEASGQPPSFYDAYKNEAQALVDAYGGVESTRRVRRQYIYEAGDRGGEGGTPEVKEDYFEAIQRLAVEVNYRAFETMGVFIYGADRDLLKSQPSMTLVERWKKGDPRGTYEVGEFDSGEWHYNRPAGKLTFSAPLSPVAAKGTQVALDRWTFAPGQVASVLRMGPYTGRWLVWQMVQSLDSDTVDFELRRPSPAKPEPAPTIETVTPGQEPGTGTGTLRDRIVREAVKTTKLGYHYYLAGGSSAKLNDPTPPPYQGYRSDCSQWIHAIYLKAGAPSPGLNTDEQERKATRTTRPAPGDLLLMPGHVELYVGDGKTIGHGSPPIDYATVAAFRPRGAYFGTFGFLDEGNDG